MEKDLVVVKNKEIFTTSLKFAEEFKIGHMEVLRKIRNIIMDYPIVKSQFVEDVFKNERNREYPFFWINRD